MKKKVIYGISLSALGIGVALTTTFSLSSCTSGPVATTEFGKVRGMTENNGILGFKGIPYAKAPVGDLRFAHPLNPEPWKNVKKCQTYGNACIQDDQGTGWLIQPQGEDCLNLNIWTPTLNPKTPMAVYVYIYGGVFTIGSNSQSVFDGHYMAYDNGNKDMVVVNVNYRLHALGFMALHSTQTQALNYADEPLYYQVNPTSVEFPTITTTRTEWPVYTNGNWGILDQIKALQWIHSNIANFGGDPGNVTIGGESAGSFSVSSLIVSPATDPKLQKDGKDLFQHAVMESGNILGLDGISSETKGLLDGELVEAPNRVGMIQLCEDMIHEMINFTDSPMGLRALRTLPAEWFAEWTKINWTSTDLPTLHTYNLHPSFDGWALPLQRDLPSNNKNSLIEVLRKGVFRNVDTIFGWNTGEGYGFVPDGSATMLINNELNPNPDEPPKLSLERIVQDRLCTTFNNGNVDPISWTGSDGYRQNMQINNQPGPVDCTKYLRDLFKYCAFASGTKEFVDRMIVAENSPDSTLQPKKHFMYNFDYFYWYPSPYYQNTFNDGATHTSELPFVFGTELEGAKLEDIHMSRSMMTYWTNFAKTGDVNSGVQQNVVWTPNESNTLGFEQAMWFRGGMNYAGEPYPVDPYEPCSMNYADSTDPRSGTGKAQYIEDFYSGKFN